MKKLITCFSLVLCVLLLVSCAPLEELYYSIFVNNQNYNNDIEVTAEKEMAFLNAYHKAAIEVDKSFDINQVKILNYYGTIGKAHVVQFNKACPGQIRYSQIEGMEFSGYSKLVYIIHKNTLYTIENAYEQNIINFDNLCRLFGINFSGKDTFNKKKYEKLQKQFKLNHPDDYDMYELLGYYGEFNGYSVVTYKYGGLQFDSICWSLCNGLAFRHGYSTNGFRIMNGENLYSLDGAFKNGILTLENILDIFEIHTHSAELSESLLNQTLSCLKKTCDEYPIQNNVCYNYWIEKYYGQYADVHIFDVFVHSSYYNEENITSDDLKKLLSMNGKYAFDGEKFYTLDEAVELGLITEEIKSQIK